MKPPKLIWVIALMLVVWSALYLYSSRRHSHHLVVKHPTSAQAATHLTNATNAVSIQWEPNSGPINNSFGRDNFTVTVTNH